MIWDLGRAQLKFNFNGEAIGMIVNDIFSDVGVTVGFRQDVKGDRC